MWVEIEGLVQFAPNNGVSVKEAILAEPPDRIVELLRLAFFHNQNQDLKDACQGGSGPLVPYLYRTLDYDSFLVALERIRIERDTRAAKKTLTRRRRVEFQSKRADLMLLMIDRGIPFVCATQDCGWTVDLTLDH